MKKIYELFQNQTIIVKNYIDKILKKKYIRYNKFDYFFSLLLIKKFDKKLKICVNYKILNAIIIKNRNASFLLKNIFIKFCFVKIYNKFDIITIFNKIYIRENNQHKIVFITKYNLFKYVVMFFELYNASKIFQNFINETFREYLNEFCIIYLDNILVYNDNLKKYIMYINLVLKKLKQIDFYLNIRKCQFHIIKIKYFNFVIIIENIKINLNKIQIIQN